MGPGAGHRSEEQRPGAGTGGQRSAHRHRRHAEEGSRRAARPAGVGSAGGGESHGDPLPELRALEGRGSDGEEVPVAARRCDLRRPHQRCDHLRHSERDSATGPAADAAGPQDAGSGNRSPGSGGDAQLGFGWGNGHSAIGGASSVGTSPTTVGGLTPGYITTGSSSGSSGGTQIPLFSNLPVTSPTSGLTFVNASNNVRIDAVLTMAESRGLLKILSRPRVVTQNNIQALVRQGVRVPIVTQAQLGGPPTVTYVDAFLRLTVVPQITSEGTIFLNVDVENTTPDFGRTVQGNPTLITQQATTQVLVTDGGTVVIGGVIQTNNSLNVQQVPVLGNIPGLGNLFKHRTVSTSNQELIFFITPRIIQT